MLQFEAAKEDGLSIPSLTASRREGVEMTA